MPKHFRDPYISAMARVAFAVQAVMEFLSTDQVRQRISQLEEQRRTAVAVVARLAAFNGAFDDRMRAEWMTANESVDQADAELPGLRARLAEREQQARATFGGPGISFESGDGATAPDRGFHTTRHVDREAALADARRAGGTETDEGGLLLFDAARSAIDWFAERGSTPEQQQSALAVVTPTDEYGRGCAEWVARFSDPRYAEAFSQFMRSGSWAGVSSDLAGPARELNLYAARAMNEGTGSAGQFVVPPFLDPALVLMNAGVSSPWRDISTIKTVTTQTWHGVSTAGIPSAEWAAEAAEFSDSSPSLGQLTLVPVRADSYIQASWELVMDSDLAQQLLMLFSDARDRLEGGASGFWSGSGTTAPLGLQTQLALTTASRVAVSTNGSLGFTDFFAADNSLSQRYRKNASWLANRAIYNGLRQQATGTGAMVGSFWVDMGPDHPASLIGYPTHECSQMISTLSTATASSDYAAVIGDFGAGYYICDRLGLSLASVPVVLGAGRRPTGEQGWAAWWRTTGAPINPDAFRCLIV